jgi:hypothetical protein
MSLVPRDQPGSFRLGCGESGVIPRYIDDCGELWTIAPVNQTRGLGMQAFEFDATRVDQHIESIGVDMRPPIDVKADRAKVQEFYNRVSERYPKLFESLVQSPTQYQIKKQLPIPGQGTAEITTFTLTPRGPVFSFPKTLPGVYDEFAWSDDLNGVVIRCLAILQSHFPLTSYIRIGKVRDLIFDCGTENGDALIRERFCHGVPEGASGVEIGWNQADERYNCKVFISALRKERLRERTNGALPQHEGEPAQEYGIRVKLDVNNVRMDRKLEPEDLQIILQHADGVYSRNLYTLLRGREE